MRPFCFVRLVSLFLFLGGMSEVDACFRTGRRAARMGHSYLTCTV
jgi:hypothetical protein